MHDQRTTQVNKMTKDQALEMIMRKTMGDAAAGPYVR
jgi:hypothetical protein